MLDLFVPGTPAPQGSKAFKGMRAGKPILVEQSTRVGPWRELLTAQLRVHGARQHHQQLDGPVHVALVFQLVRGKTVKREHPTTPPDLDKLTRAVLDSCTAAGVWRDDSQVCSLHVRKLYATGTTRGPNGPGVRISVSPLV
jgi:Holliday junction resolvase RusA-like endonuclease